MPRIRTIKVKKGYADGKMDLSPRRPLRAWKSDIIIWEIEGGSGVKFINGIELKEGSANVFLAPPYPNGLNWRADIRSDVNEGDESSYTIHWTDTMDNSRKFDPIITIKPSLFGDLDEILVDTSIGIAIGVAVGAGTSYLFQISDFSKSFLLFLAGIIIGSVSGYLLGRKPK